jgi:hypothetical protein
MGKYSKAKFVRARVEYVITNVTLKDADRH